MHAGDRGERQELQREIAVGDRIDRIARRLAEAERLRRHVPVDRKARAGERGGSERALVHAFDRVMRAPEVAAAHLHIGHQMMAEGDRLGGLKMGEARHHRRRVLLGTVEQHRDQRFERRGDPLRFLLHPETEIDGDLVVARARRVQPPGRRSDQFGKRGLDVHVDVLEPSRELEPARLDL